MSFLAFFLQAIQVIALEIVEDLMACERFTPQIEHRYDDILREVGAWVCDLAVISKTDMTDLSRLAKWIVSHVGLAQEAPRQARANGAPRGARPG
jgi:hypothetical protein